jgi:hypothetical protein
MTRARDVADVQDNLGGAVPPFVAGKNKIINGDFGVWQRGTSFTNLQGFFADRFQTVPTGAVTSMTTSQQTFTPGTAPVAEYEGSFFARNTITTVGSLTNLDLVQRIENVRTFAGQTATLSFWAKADSARSSIVYLEQTFGGGGSGTTYSATPTLSVTTSWVRYSFTIAVPSIAGKTIGTNSFLGVGIRQVVAAGSVLDLWGVQLEAGSLATPFTTATGTIQGELAACQRYYQKSYNQGVTVPTNVSFGGSITGPSTSTVLNQSYGYIKFPVVMRIAPTVTTYSYTSSTTSVISNASGTDQAAGSGVASGIGDSGFGLYNSAATVTTTNGWLIHFQASSEL